MKPIEHSYRRVSTSPKKRIIRACKRIVKCMLPAGAVARIKKLMGGGVANRTYSVIRSSAICNTKAWLIPVQNNGLGFSHAFCVSGFSARKQRYLLAA